MPVTYPIALPFANRHTEITFQPVDIVGQNTSIFTGQQEVQVHQGKFWTAQIKLSRLGRADADQWKRFFLRLKGLEGTFLMGDPDRATPIGSASGTPGVPVVAGAGQSGDQLMVSGLPVSTTGYLKALDYFQLGTGATARLYQLYDDVDSDAGGLATLSFWPDLRTSPANLEAVTVVNAQTTWRLNEDTRKWNAERGILHTVNFPAIREAI